MARQRLRSALLAGVIGLMLAGVAQASVLYSTTWMEDNGDGNSIWKYSFTVLPTQDFTDLLVMFQYDYFLDLYSPVAGTGWDTTGTSAPIPYVANGYFVASNSLVQPAGTPVYGFSVLTVALSSPKPPAVHYELYNGATLSPVESGDTIPTPEPSTYLLVLLGFGGLVRLRRRSC